MHPHRDQLTLSAMQKEPRPESKPGPFGFKPTEVTTAAPSSLYKIQLMIHLEFYANVGIYYSTMSVQPGFFHLFAFNRFSHLFHFLDFVTHNLKLMSLLTPLNM